MDGEYIDRMKLVADHFQQARRLLDKGPLDYYFAKLVEHSEALLTKFAPLKVGDRATVISAVPCPGDWARTARSLDVGAIGTITDVDYRDGDFVLSFQPDLQVRLKGDLWIETGDRYCYPLKAEYLGPI